MPPGADMTPIPIQALASSPWLSAWFRLRETIERLLATNPRRFIGWPWLKATCLAVGQKIWYRRRERESAVRAAALICLLLLPGIALDSSRPAAAGTGFF